MSTKQLFIGPILVGLLLIAPARAQGQATKAEPTATGRQNQPAAPILHRSTTLPAGWFKQGQAAGALTDTQVAEARPVSHFDTLGPEAEASGSASGAARRLRQIRETVVLDTVPPAPPKDGSAADGSAVSSRRAADSSSPIVTPDAQGAEQNEAVPPTGAPSTTSQSNASQSNSAPPQILGTVGPQQPLTGGPDAATAGTTAGTLPGVDQLPSVMKRPEAQPLTSAGQTVDRSRTTEPMKLIAVDPQANDPVSSAPLTTQTIDDLTPVVTSADEGAADAVLIENESPILSVVTRGPKTIVVGKPATYVVDLGNRSEVAAKDVVVRMNIPQWVEIVQQTTSNGVSQIRPDDSGNAILAWRVDRLSGRGQEKLILELIPRGNRPLDLGVTWTFSPAQSVTQIQVQEPKLQISVVGPQDVLFGETKVYTITVSNPGTGDADDVVLNLLPLVPGEKPAGVRSLGTIPAGTRQTMEVELTARQTGRLEVRAEVSGDGGLMARGQQDVLVRRAALEVQVEGPPMKYAGTRARYAVRVANTGDAPAIDVVVVANLPAGAKEVGGSDGGSYDANSGQIQWRLGELRPGASRAFEMECTLMSPGDNRVDLRSVAAGDLSALGSTVTQVESLADLKLSVNDPQGAVAVGSDVVYELRITNRGTKAAENIQVYGYFSEGIEPIGVAGWKGQLSEGEVVLQMIPRLGAGQEMVVRVTAQASRPGDHVFRTELECSDPETKLAIEEWTRFYGDQPTERQADRRQTPPTARTPAPAQPLRNPR